MTHSVEIQEIRQLVSELTKSQQETNAQIKAEFEEVAARFRDTDTQFKEIRAQFEQTRAQNKAELEEIAAQFKEMRAQFEQTHAQNKAELKEIRALFKETDMMLKETSGKFKANESKVDKIDQRIKEAFDLFEGQWGKLIESLVEGDLIRLLQERGVMIRDTSTRRKGSYKGTNYEFDIIAHNGDEIVVVEVKTTLRVRDVQHFMRKMEHVKTWLPEYKSFKVYGAIAYLRAEQQSIRYAERQRLFIIRATGNSASIVNDTNFVPKAF